MPNHSSSSRRFQMMITACVISVLNVPSGHAQPSTEQRTLASTALLQDIPHTKDSLKEVKKRVESKSAVLLDIREVAEWNDGHLKDAMLVPLSELKKRNPNASVRKILDKLDKDKPVYCHCRSGRRVLTAAPLLKKMGFDIRPLKAGFDELRENGFKVANP